MYPENDNHVKASMVILIANKWDFRAMKIGDKKATLHNGNRLNSSRRHNPKHICT